MTDPFAVALAHQHIRVVLTSFGILHQDPPLLEDALTVDLTEALRNPHHDPAMRELTGLDRRVREHVLSTPGATEIIESTLARIEAALTVADPAGELVFVHVYCRGGRHRSVAIAERVAVELRVRGIGAEVTHRHLDRPVVQQ